MSDPDAIARFYGRWAGVYDLVATRTPGIGTVRDRAADALSLAPGDVVADVGCGTGANLPHLRDRVGARGRVVGLDLTPGMLARARRRCARMSWENVDVVRGDAARPPVVEADAVLASFVVGMLADPAAAVRTWTDLVGPGGRVALLDAAPRDGRGVLDSAFSAFVAATAPPTFRLRYDGSPAGQLGERVEAAHGALGATCVDVDRSSHLGGFVQLVAGRVEGG